MTVGVGPCFGELCSDIDDDGGVVYPGDEDYDEGCRSEGGTYFRHAEVEGYGPLACQEQDGGEGGAYEDVLEAYLCIGQIFEEECKDYGADDEVEGETDAFEYPDGYVGVVLLEQGAEFADEGCQCECDEHHKCEGEDDGKGDESVDDELEPATLWHCLDPVDEIEGILEFDKDGGGGKDGGSDTDVGHQGCRCCALGGIVDDGLKGVDYIVAKYGLDECVYLALEVDIE